jgi:hypothetical protein
MGKATLASPNRPTGGYRILMPVHYLPDAILGSFLRIYLLVLLR